MKLHEAYHTLGDTAHFTAHFCALLPSTSSGTRDGDDAENDIVQRQERALSTCKHTFGGKSRNLEGVLPDSWPDRRPRRLFGRRRRQRLGDPFVQNLGDFQIVLLQHHGVAVSVDSDVRELDPGVGYAGLR